MKKMSLWLLILAASIQVNAQKAEKIKLEDIWKSAKYRSEGVYGLRSMNDGLHYTTLDYSNDGAAMILKYSYASGKLVDTLFNAASLNQRIQFSDYSFSTNEDKILLFSKVEQIYRHSTAAENHVFTPKTKELIHLTSQGKHINAAFSPSGKLVAYVRENNLFFYDLSTKEETQITQDGEKNKIINGFTDWVYEEEFSFHEAFFWSPDEKHIAFYRFDETEVPEFNMPVYGGQLYPKDFKFKYPKAGEVNSKVQILSYNLASQKTTKVCETVENTFEYVPRVQWAFNNQLAYQMMNRHQSELYINLFDVNTLKTDQIYFENSETYIEVPENWYFKNELLYFTSEKDGFRHIYQLNLKSKKLIATTQGNWDIIDFYGIDNKGEYLYFASAEESPTTSQIYRIRSNGKGKEKLSSKRGWNTADFSKGMNFFINTWSDANTAPYTSLHNAKGKEIRMLKNNETLNKRLKELNLPSKDFFSFKTEIGHELNAWIIRPMNFRPDRKYPVLLTIYGGPGSQQVKDQFGGANYLWHHLLADMGYIVVSVDNRGTGARGAEFKKCTYKQLGKLELEDYIETAKYLLKQTYVDAQRIGIWGWSYGGYMSSLALTKGHEYFKAGIAVAPVTNWRFYDNIYTERYMQTPQENANGYDDNSPINHVHLLSGKYLLIHGTADDNVHYQNAAEMTTALVNANKQFDMFIYPDKNHGIYGGNTRYHLYKLMTDWLREKL
jgi:dipeptidyl-peptidase 4